MKKFLIAGSGLAAVAAAGSAGAVDVTLGGSIEMGIEYGLGKKVDGFAFSGSSAYQSVSLSIAAAGTTDAGMKFGGSFALSTADELKLDLYDNPNAVNAGSHKTLVKLVNSEATAGIKGVAYNISGGQKVKSGSIVSVKINSAWQAAKTKVTGYTLQIDSIAANSAICKVAGQGRNTGSTSLFLVGRANTAGDAFTKAPTLAIPSVSGDIQYLPAGQLTEASAANAVQMTFANSTANAAQIHADTANDADANDMDALFSIGTAADEDKIIADAKVFVGPFASVKMTSSTTKMVVGAVCVTNKVKASSTKAYLDLNSRIMQVGAASIFVEGGFGKLTLQQGDYSGKVASIGSAGDQATISSSGLVAVLEGASLMGMAGYAAVDVGSIAMGQRPNYMLGTSVDLMGLTVAVEMEDEYAATDNEYIDNWDMGTTYALGDMSIDAVLDSAGDWALSASGSVAGFTATSVIENVAKGKSKKAGLSIDTTLATTFNGMNISIGLDEDLDYSLSGSYSIGNSGLAITASYSSEDQGGKVSAKLSF